MTDQTTARDRAIDLAQAEIMKADHARFAHRIHRDFARAAVDALLTSPEVLRALVGAPSADAAVVRAPFTEAQQEALYRWQNNPVVHPFTCPTCGIALIVDKHWRCSDCDYTQYWAHAFMAAAPEGVDVADVMAGWPSLDEEEAEAARAEQRQRDGMDLEAQGEMDDQLDVTQAAIQRVRTEYARAWRTVRAMVSDDLADALDALCALDGDTTEEGR